MILDDEIELLDRDNNYIDTIDCKVAHRSLIDLDDRGANVIIDEMVILIEPDDRATLGRKYFWRGQRYVQPGQPTVRRRHGEDHHFTIRLRQDF